MPRESTIEAPTVTSAIAAPAERLEEVLQLLRRTRGWTVGEQERTWTIIGPSDKPITVKKDPTFQNLKALEYVLGAEGWTPEHAEINAVEPDIRPDILLMKSVAGAPGLQDSPTEESRSRLSQLIEMVRRTPGWRCISENGGWRIIGGTSTIIVPSAHLALHDVEGIEQALADKGWDKGIAEAHIARVDAIYDKFRTQVPDGGYPKADRIITRIEASYLLRFTEECGCNYRPPRQRKIDQYSEAMKRGEWRMFSPQGLVLSAEHGCLLDGRQRLMGLVQSGLPGMGFSITSEVPIAEFPYLDQGASRTIADLLVSKNIPRSAGGAIGAALKLAMGYDSKMPWKRWHTLNLTGGQILEALDGEYEGIVGKPYNDAMTLGWDKRTSQGLKMAPAVATAASFLIQRDYPKGGWAQFDEDDRPAYEYADDHPWEQFRTSLVTGANLREDDPRASFRSQMIGRDQKVKRRYENYLQLGGILKTWELWLNDISGLVQFKDNQEMPRVWIPGMPLSGKDARRAVQRRQARAAARAQGIELPEDD